MLRHAQSIDSSLNARDSIIESLLDSTNLTSQLRISGLAVAQSDSSSQPKAHQLYQKVPESLL